jgi:hypothetical protein
MNYSKHAVTDMKKTPDYSFLLVLIATPVLIFLYFLKWRTSTIYGDDVSLYLYQTGAHSLTDKINMDLIYQKYRPVHGLAMQGLVTFFQKNLGYYYLFNVSIQTINTFLFAGILNLFLRSRWWSLAFALIVGLSRFAFFNISQLFNGGALEGLAMTFFFLSLFFVVKALVGDDHTARDKQRGMIAGILFANLSMYTHERYIVLFLFLALVILTAPALTELTKNRRVALALGALASVILNVVIKKFVFSVPFFVGTGGTSIGFSFSSVISFLADALLSILQINSGPTYLAGATFFSLPLFDEVLALILAGGCLTVAVLYLIRIRKAYMQKDKGQLSRAYLLFLLGILFALLLAPAVVSIRLEQRWLQGSSAIFILMLVAILTEWQLKRNYVKAGMFFLFVLLFIWTDYNYLDRGGANLYMVYSQKLAVDLKKAMDKGIIRPSSRRLYLWLKRRDSNIENAIRWNLGDGGFFEYYQGQFKKLIFIDSVYERSYPFSFSAFASFNDSTDQILYLNDNVADITRYFRKDSLQYFSGTKIDELLANKQVQYDGDLLIEADSLNNFQASGFYGKENGIAWTNGSAGIGLVGDYTVKDSLEVALHTYLPPICKGISPRIVLVDDKNKEYQAIAFKRVEDRFSYAFYFGQFTTIQTVKILSDTIHGAPDPRMLSFPFVSLEMKN